MGIALQARHPNENLENNLQLESFSVSSVCSVDYYHRNLDGIYTETKSLKKILNKMRSSSGCCPGLGKPLGFQPVFACVSKSLEESLTRIYKL